MPTTLRVFDPAMSCSSGVCGPSIDADLARRVALVPWFQQSGDERLDLVAGPSSQTAPNDLLSHRESATP